MMYGIMGALQEEVNQLCAKLRDVTVESYAGVAYHKGTLHGQPVVVCSAGMGKANAASTTQVLITKYGAQRVIFSGIAGNMTPRIGIGDVVVGETVFYHDAEDSMLAQSAPFTAQFPGDPVMVAAAMDACARLGVKAIAGRIATGDKFIGDPVTKQEIAGRCHPDCVEMEGAAVAQVAGRNGVPCVILRAMSDNAEESGDKILSLDIERYCTTAAALVAELIEWL